MSLNDTKNNIAVIVQARMGSTRFPGKILEELMVGETVLSYLLKRLSKCRCVDKIIVATTTNPKDDILEEWLKRYNYLFYRGSEEDCLDRFCRTCAYFDVGIIIRITSDSPLVIPEIIDAMIKYYLNNQEEIDYLSNRQYTNFPEGLDVEIFSRRILEEAAKNSTDQKEREHINYYFLNRDSQYKIRYYNHDLEFDYSRFKLSIDTPQDLEQARRFFKEKKLPFNFSFQELITVLTN
ncbi:MAG: glycosyltransferase family protein [Candidatus Omnitrophica bacterium]|nr:glycosyltransferase family protein [Candidatus Omnitrophota bacterium]MDD5352663.1 glycosyltransferase family protein [Candidatus Omnitrophota bacterium]MDD5550262.1 glycosyltransferase family protein [Candidatus Omnitrophota bacterium]